MIPWYTIGGNEFYDGWAFNGKRLFRCHEMSFNLTCPVDNFGTVVGENPTPYGILALWAVNSLSIVYWDGNLKSCVDIHQKLSTVGSSFDLKKTAVKGVRDFTATLNKYKNPACSLQQLYLIRQ